jgi:hypothetical protein
MDLSAQVALQQQLNKALQERTKLLEEHNKQLQTQSDLSAKIGDNLGNPSTSRRLRDMSSSIRASSDGLRDAIEGARNYDEALNDAADAAEEAADSTSILSSAISGLSSAVSSVAGGIFSLAKGGFSSLIGGLKSLGSAVFSITATMGKFAFSILSFPFKIFDSLISMSQTGGGGMPIREAMEEVRESFGDLASGTGKAIISTFREVNKQGRMLGDTGLSIRKVFGYGRQGMAEYLKDLNATLVATGDNVSRLKEQFLALGGDLAGFQRGLGLSKEEFAELGNIAEMRGQDIAKSFTEFGSTAIQTAKRFGLDVKDMAKGMKELSLNVDDFGHLGPKAFAPITAYARKLGLEIKDMAGVMDKFSGFADTTEAASKLSQAFGLNIDSMQLMSAQNPAEKIDILRKSFFGAGKDLSKLNYQQRKYLTSLTGLQGKSLEAAFALDKQGISYSDIQAAADEANEAQMSQEEVMAELGKNIKRMVQIMSGKQFTGFFDAFAKGFERGVMRSKEFFKLFRNIRNGLKKIYWLGVDVGRAFVDSFPGVKSMLEALNEFFAPKKFKDFRKAAFPIFKELFVDMDFDKFFDKIKKLFTETFGDANTSKFLSGFDSFMTGMTKIAGQAMAKLIKIVMEGMLFVGKLLADPDKAIADLKKSSSAVGGALGKYTDNLLDPTLALLEEEGKEGGMLGQLKETYGKVFKRFSNWLTSTVPGMLESGWASITGWFKSEKGQDAMKEAEKYVKELWEKTLKPALMDLWEQAKAWWNSEEVKQIRDDIGKALKQAIIDAFEYVKNWAKENPGTAAAALALMFPGTTLAVGGLLVKAVSGMLSTAVRGALNLLPRLPGLVSLAQGAISGIFGGIKTAALTAMGAISAPVLAIGTAVIAGFATAYNANKILNDPRLKDTGITTGEAVAGGYLKFVTFGYEKEFANWVRAPFGGREEKYSVEEILTHQAKISAESKARLKKGTKKQANEAVESLREADKILEKELAVAMRKGDTGAIKEIEKKLLENEQLIQKSMYIGTDDYILNQQKDNEKAIQAAFARAKTEGTKIYEEKIAERRRKIIEEVIPKLEKDEDLKKMAEAEAKIAMLDRKNRIAESLKRLADMPKKLEAAMAGVKDINAETIMKDAIQLTDKLGMILQGLDPLLETVDKVITTQAKFAKLSTRLTSIDKISANLNLVNIGKLPKIGPKISRFAKSLARAAKSITDDEVKKITPIVQAVSGFKGGKVEVQSNLPDKFDINLSVTIDSRELAQEIVRTRISGTGAEKKYPTVGPAANGPKAANLTPRP